MINAIQIRRGFAAWRVVLHHAAPILFNDKINSTLVKHMAKKGAMGVDIFFVISGFIIYKTISNNATSVPDFYMKRVRRVVPGYWLLDC